MPTKTPANVCRGRQPDPDPEMETAANALLSELPVDGAAEYPILSARQLQRRTAREYPLLEELDQAPDPDPAEAVIQWAEIEFALDSAGLAREERACWILRERYGLTDGELAAVFGYHRETAWRRRTAAQAKLRRLRGVP